MELAARSEIKSIQKIIDALNPLIEKIENIPELKIPKEDTTLPSKESNISLGDSSTVSDNTEIKANSEVIASIEKRNKNLHLMSYNLKKQDMKLRNYPKQKTKHMDSKKLILI